MAKFYIKTVVSTIIVACLVLFRLRLLIYEFPIPDFLSNFLILFLITVIIINEKLTKGEKWIWLHYILLLMFSGVYLFILVLCSSC